MLSAMKRFLGYASGNIAIALALASIPLVGLAGGVVDYSRVLSLKEAAQAAADAGALAGAKMHDYGDDKLKRKVREHIKTNFEAADQLSRMKIDVVREASGEVKVQINGRLKTSFLRVLDMPKLDFAVSSSASETLVYTDVYLLMDRSASQMIADGNAAINALMALTKPYIQAYGDWYASAEPEGCAFACHRSNIDGDPWQPAGQTLLEFARANNIPIRSDRVARAANLLVDKLAEASREDAVRFAIIDFAADSKLTQAPTTNLRRVRDRIATADANLDLGQTAYPELLQHATGLIGRSGDATSPSASKKYAILITDGLHTWSDSGGPHYDPFDSSGCEALKANDVTVAVINTIYDPLPFSWRYDELAEPNIDQAARELERCASDGYYFRANKPGDIEAAFEAVADKVKWSALRLLN